MTMIPPYNPVQMGRYGSIPFPDVEPFSIRSGASYENVLSAIRVYLRDTVQPFIEENAAGAVWIQNAAALTDLVNGTLDEQDAQFRQLYGTFYAGSITAPAPTGDASIDTPNLIAAFKQANDTYSDLILAPSPLGAIRSYRCNSPLVWNLNRSSLLTHGTVSINFSGVPTTYAGAAFTVGSDTASSGDGGHLSGTHRIEGVRLLGHGTDTSLMDGIKIVESATGFGNDFGVLESVFVDSFRDNLTFGINVWNFDFRKCSFRGARRYNINLAGGTGECQQFTECNVFGANNAAGTAANLYAPAGQTTDVRFYGGSFDYPGGGGGPAQTGQPAQGGTGGIQGIIEGGSISFDKVHFEDSNASQMFTYANNNVGTIIDVTFRDCHWNFTGNAVRETVHEIKPSTRDSITIRFSGDRGAGTAVSIKKWIVDNSGTTTNAIVVTYDAWRVINNGGITPATAFQLGNSFNNLLVNGNLESSQSYVTTPGTGWVAGGVGSWGIGPGSARGAGNCIQFTGTGTGGTNITSNRTRIAPNRRPIRAVAFQSVTAYTSGSVGTYVRFYAEDGTTPIGSDYRLGTDISAVTNYDGRSRTIMPPAGAAYAAMLCVAGSFNGSAQWDDLEIVQL